MHITATTVMVALFGATAYAGNNQNVFSIWSSTDCSGSPIRSFTGDTTYHSNFVTNYKGRVGSIKFDKISDFAGQLNDSTSCVITNTLCCAYAPKCKINEYGNFNTCTKIDMDIDLVVAYTLCDTLCFDNIYGRRANGAKVAEIE